MLYSALPNTRNAPKIVEGILEEFCPGANCDNLRSFLEKNYNDLIEALDETVVRSISYMQGFLNENQTCFGQKNLPFFPGEPYAQLERCRKVMGRLYADDYPLYRIDFVSLSNERGFQLNGFQLKTERSLRKYLRLFLLSRSATSHEELATKKNLGEIVFMQGCGDLTMNLWSVAFVSGPSCHVAGGWKMVHAPDEPLNDRQYACLLKWNCPKDELQQIARQHRVVYPYQIADVLLRAPSVEEVEKGRLDRHVFLPVRDWQGEREPTPIGHLIEFAVSGKQLCRNGQTTEEVLRAAIPQLSDIRHVYRLPNLNRGIPYEKEAHRSENTRIQTEAQVSVQRKHV